MASGQDFIVVRWFQQNSPPDGWVPTAHRFGTAYARMSATIVAATVTRMCFDCVGFILAGKRDSANYFFWFAKCDVTGNHIEESVGCLRWAVYLFAVAILFCSLLLWGVSQWISDPAQNPLAMRFSFRILVDALTWVPISVCVGKMNVLIEWLMDVTTDDAMQAVLTIECVVIVTGVAALLAHVGLKYVEDVANAHRITERNFKSFCKALVLTTLSTFPWAVGWNSWKVVRAILDLVEGKVPKTVRQTSSYTVLAFFMIVSIYFYSRFGPEPAIPDPQTQQAAYGNPYTGSVLRAMIALIVYSCVVFNVMCITDPEYGLLYKFLKLVHPALRETPEFGDFPSILTLFLWFCAVTAVAVLASVGITACTSVDMSTSAKLSRQVVQTTSKQRELFKQPPPRPYYHRQSSRESTFTQELQEGLMPDREVTPEPSDGDDAAGPRLDADVLLDNDANSGAILTSEVSMTTCVSILVFDVLGLVVCMIWGAFSMRLYYNMLGYIARLHPALYMISVLLYAVAIIALVSRVAFVWFPDVEEIAASRHAVDAACPLFSRRMSGSWSGGRSSDDTDVSVFTQMRDVAQG
mmetsp:Transcript_43886/g.80191  ORF Transcript_43886/g.80191 Transcript_43886/m.80191 type:complete len:580 (-) Transcript_43886:35-1774(-)